jgi:uncharacterized C2H2 Zn-finger protein
MVENQQPLNCEHVSREISNYIDEDTPSRLRAEMDEHFKSCPRCASLLAGTRNVIALYSDERMLEAPEGFGIRLKKRIDKNLAREFPGQRQRRASWLAWLVPVAALLLVIAGLKLTNSVTYKTLLKSEHAQPANNIPPDLTVVVSDGEKLFHAPGCKFIKDPNSERTMTAKQAMQEGYTPCPRCLRQYLKSRLIAPDLHSGDVEDTEEEEDRPINAAVIR